MLDKKTSVKYAIVKYAIVSLLVLVGAVFGWAVFAPLEKGAEPQEFVIEKGDSSAKVARLLGEQGLVRSRYLFVLYTVFVGKEKKFQAGQYLISRSMSMSRIVDIFSGGKTEPLGILVTIPEGTNLADMAKILYGAGIEHGGEVLDKNNLVYEGFLFPDTYRFAKDEETNEILARMLQNFSIKTDGVLNTRDMMGRENKKAVIIASLLEKEVKTEPDMKIVAGIIEKRLKLGMPLEIDAAVAYGACYSKFLGGEYCDVSQANITDGITSDSAYNTYKIKGLPPGPISNPGLTALGAALNPQASGYLYYLSTRDGTTIFSKTAAEHVRARVKYLR